MEELEKSCKFDEVFRAHDGVAGDVDSTALLAPPRADATLAARLSEVDAQLASITEAAENAVDPTARAQLSRHRGQLFFLSSSVAGFARARAGALWGRRRGGDLSWR